MEYLPVSLLVTLPERFISYNLFGFIKVRIPMHPPISWPN